MGKVVGSISDSGKSGSGADYATHPIYKAMEWEWEFYRLSYVGGSEYLRPTIAQTQLVATGYGDDSIKWNNYSYNSFLWRHDREREEKFLKRHAQSYYRNFAAPGVNLIASHITRANVQRDFEAHPSLGVIAPDVDMRGTSISEWMRQGLQFAEVFGHCFAVVDMPRVPFGEPKTLADEYMLGLRPYASWYTPQQVIDWEVDERGEFIWVRILESDYRQMRITAAMDAPSAKLLCRTWYRDHWELSDGDDLLDSGANIIGRVPVAVLYNERIPGNMQPVGRSRICDIAHVCRDIYNLDSLKDDMLRNQGFAFLAIPDKAGRVSRVDVGTSSAMTYDPDGGIPQYVAPPTSCVDSLRQEIAEKILSIRAMFGLTRGTADASIAARSGEALLIETQDKGAVLRSLAVEAESFERKLWSLMGAWTGDADAAVSVRYPDVFDVTTMADEFDNAAKLLALSPPSSVRSEAMVRVVSRYLAEMPDDKRAAIENEIRSAARYKWGFVPSSESATLKETKGFTSGSSNTFTMDLNGVQIGSPPAFGDAKDAK